MAETVARIGKPCSPKTSKKRVGQPANCGFSMPNSGMRFSMKPLSLPAWLMPERSPFISAMKQGTPAWEKVSASTCRVTVLPVPVAPAIRPCRLAIFPTMLMFPLSLCAM